MLALSTVVLFITTVLFGLMALAPGSAPIRPGAVQQAAQSEAEDRIEAVADRMIRNLLNYSHETVDDDFERALADATDDFATRRQEAIESGTIADLRETILRTQAVGSARILSAKVTSRDEDTATALVVAHRTIDNNQRPEPIDQVLVVSLNLVDTPDGWKVDGAVRPTEGDG